jgi:hypothetical protein
MEMFISASAISVQSHFYRPHFFKLHHFNKQSNIVFIIFKLFPKTMWPFVRTRTNSLWAIRPDPDK